MCSAGVSPAPIALCRGLAGGAPALQARKPDFAQVLGRSDMMPDLLGSFLPMSREYDALTYATFMSGARSFLITCHMIQ